MRDAARRHRPRARACPATRRLREEAGQRVVGSSGQPAGPGHRPAGRACRCEARAVSPSSPSAPGTNGPTSTQVQRLLRDQPQVLRLRRHRHPGPVARLGLSLHRRRRASSCATPACLRRQDTWQTQDTLTGRPAACAVTSSRCTRSGRPARTCARFAAIQGDYGHVASKNGVGAVMGKKQLKAVAIGEGHQGAPRRRPAGASSSAADEIAHDLRTDPVRALAVRVRHAARRREPEQDGRAADPATTRPASPTPT